MAKQWNIKLEDKEYTITHTRTNWIVNGTKYPQKKCLTFKKYFFFSEYKLPIPEAEVYLVTGKLGWLLVVDGKYLSSGKPYHRIESIPVWTWVFIALYFPMLMGGAIGGACGGAGAMMTIRACSDPESSVKKKIVSSVLILGAAWIAMLVLAGLFSAFFK